jgi:hypothetical protein
MANDKWVHTYHAEAHALRASFQFPVTQEIQPQAFARFQGNQDGYYSEQAKAFRLEGVLSYQSAYTQVAGHRSPKQGHGFTTLATAVVEKLNILEVLTVDRIVSQISTDHPDDDRPPTVTFLGTHFENLRIAGHEVDVELNLGLCGARPSAKSEEGSAVRPYITHGSSFMNAVSKSYDDLHANLERSFNAEDREMEGRKELPDFFRKHYHRDLLDPAKIAAQGKDAKIECSLVKSLKVAGVGKPFGHLIHVPDFGKISLADLTVKHNSFNLTMINFHLGCTGTGTGGAGSTNVNGGGGTH